MDNLPEQKRQQCSQHGSEQHINGKVQIKMLIISHKDGDNVDAELQENTEEKTVIEPGCSSAIFSVTQNAAAGQIGDCAERNGTGNAWKKCRTKDFE